MNEKNNNILGYIGGLIGALVATIPWVLVYVYAGWILSLLAIIIAYGGLKGYKLLGGKQDKGTAIMVVITTIIAITAATFVIIPLLLLQKEGATVSLDNLKYIYSYDGFARAIIGDYVISLIFAGIGISGIVRNLSNGGTINENILGNTTLVKDDLGCSDEDIEKIRKVFEKYQAFDKKSTITRQELERDLDLSNKSVIISNLKKQKIINGNNKMYFDDKAYQVPLYRKNLLRKEKIKKTTIIIAIVLLCISAIIYLSVDDFKDDNINTTEKEKFNLKGNYVTVKLIDNTTVKLPEFLDLYSKDVDEEYFLKNNYYSFVYMPSRINMGDSVIKTLYIDYLPEYYYGDYDDFVSYYYNNSSDTYKIKETNYKSLSSDVELIEIIAINEKEKKIYYDYYLFNNGNSVFFEFITYSDEDVIMLEEIIDKVINSIDWQNNNI